LLKKLGLKSEFNRNVLTLMTGTTVAQAIPVAISPILTRIYTPDDFGVLALFAAITMIFGSIANGRYELAIMLPRKDEDAINIFALGFIITCIISFVLLLLAIFFNDYFTSLLGNEEISFWLYFVPIAIFFIGLFNLLKYFNNRLKNYKDLRNATIFKSIVSAVTQISIGFIKQGATGLISGQIISNIFANMKLLKNISKDKSLVSKISKIKVLALAKKYKKFPLYSLPSTFADTSSKQLPSLLIPSIFNLALSGYFMLAKRIVTMPSSLISDSISQVFYQSMVATKNEKYNLQPLLFKTFRKLIFIAFPIALILFLLSPYLFPFVFGKNWRISGEIAQYLSLVFFINFIVSPLSISFAVTMELEKIALWQYSYLASTCLLFLFFVIFECKFKTFLLFFVIHEYLLYLIYLYLIIQTVKKIDKLG